MLLRLALEFCLELGECKDGRASDAARHPRALQLSPLFCQLHRRRRHGRVRVLRRGAHCFEDSCRGEDGGTHRKHGQFAHCLERLSRVGMLRPDHER